LVYHGQTFENEFKKEARFLQKLNHPHIVRMIHAKVDDETAAAATEKEALSHSKRDSARKRERNKSGESAKSDKSCSSSSSSDDK
jgi:serine/threonine protein kinase